MGQAHERDVQYLGAKLLDLWIVREQTCDGLWSVSFLAGVGVGRLRHQGDIEEVLAVRRQRVVVGLFLRLWTSL